MKIEMGKQYRTKAGHEVRIYATDGAGKYPIHGAFKLDNDEWFINNWKSDGEDSDYSDAHHLVEACAVEIGMNNQHLIMTKAYNIRYWKILRDELTVLPAVPETANEVEIKVLGLFNDNGISFKYPEEQSEMDMVCYMLSKAFNNGRESIRKEFNDLMKGHTGDTEIV